MRKLIILLSFFVINFSASFSNSDEKSILTLEILKTKFPNVKNYKIEKNIFVYVVQDVTNQHIFEYNTYTNQIRKISTIWNFLELAKYCDGLGENIYFAQNKEYYFMGGYNENPDIRAFNLYQKNPWHDNYLAIIPDIDYMNDYCEFYIPMYENLINPYLFDKSKSHKL